MDGLHDVMPAAGASPSRQTATAAPTVARVPGRPAFVTAEWAAARRDSSDDGGAPPVKKFVSTDDDDGHEHEHDDAAHTTPAKTLDDNNGADGAAAKDPDAAPAPAALTSTQLNELADKGELLNTSTNAPPCSIMISYSRKDKIFVRNVYDAIEADRRNIWVDWEDIPPSNDWLDEIHKGIEQSDVFVFVLSPESVHSEVCSWEVDHAVKHGKRIVPIVCQEVDYREVRKDLARLNWIFFREDGDDFDASIKLMLKCIDHDRQHVQLHTQLLTRAIQWEVQEFEKSLLIRGKDLKRAQHWLSSSALGAEPKPTSLHLSFITESQRLADSERRRLLVAVFFVFTVAIAIPEPQWGVFFFALVFSHFLVYFASNLRLL